MTASATAQTTEKTERARENSEYVRSLLNVRQPQFAAALESAEQKLSLRPVSAPCGRCGRPSSARAWACSPRSASSVSSPA